MKSVKSLLLTVILAAGLLTTTFAQGNNFEKRRNFRDGQREERVCFKELNLTDVQQDKLFKIKQQNDEQRIDLKAKMQKLRLKKREANLKMNFDNLKSINESLSKIRTEMMNLRVDQRKSFTELLTKEQLVIYKKNLKDRSLRRNHRGEKKGFRKSKQNKRQHRRQQF